MSNANTAQTRRDENVHIPAAVRAAAARSEELLNQANGQTTPAPEQEVTPKVTPEPAPEPAAAKPEDTPAPEPKKPEVDEKEWENRYKSMKGRYDALQSQMAEQSQEIGNLRSLIASLKAQAPITPAPTTTEVKKLVTKEEEDEYGPELVDLIGRKAMEVAAQMTASQQAKIDALEARLGDVGQHIGQSTRNQLFASLDTAVPNWKELNNDPKFISWLQLPDVYSGDIRHKMLNAAFEANDGSRVAAFFKGFLAEEAATAPAAIETAPTPEESGKVPLEELAAPGRAKSAATSAVPAEKPFFTSAQITKFYTDVAAGRYKGKETERAKLEKQIFSAQSEGRIRT